MNDYKESEREELLRYVEEMQDQIESLQKENRKLASQAAKAESEKQQTISELSSQISMLKKAVQEKSEKITEQKKQIEEMKEGQMESDRILQEYENLTLQNRDLQKNLQDTRKDLQAEVDRVEQKKEKEIDDLKIQAWVKNLKMENACHKQKREYRIMTGVLGFLGLFMIILEICNNAYIRKDFIAAPGRIGNGILRASSWLFGIAGNFAGLADKIPIELLAVILHWVLVILFFAVIVAIISAVLILAEKGFAWYRKWHNLKVTGVVLACVLLLLIFVVEEVRYVAFCP